MKNKEFMELCARLENKSLEILEQKGKEYSPDDDRFHNFKAAGAAQSISPEQALWSMAMKHVISISDMVKEPNKFSQLQWIAKTGDLKNYLRLLEAMIIGESDRDEKE